MSFRSIAANSWKIRQTHAVLFTDYSKMLDLGLCLATITFIIITQDSYRLYQQNV